MTINEIWQALDAGKTVNNFNENYEITIEPTNGSIYAKFSERGTQCLRVTCVSNYFGSLITEQDLNQCFIKEIKK